VAGICEQRQRASDQAAEQLQRTRRQADREGDPQAAAIGWTMGAA
jgi:hypothetical protein